MCAVPNMAAFCISLISCFPSMLLRHCLGDFEMVPVAPVITGITFAFTFYMHEFLLWGRYILKSLLLLLLLLLSLTFSHFSAPICWETFTYPRLSVELFSVRGRKFIPSPKVMGRVLEICVLRYTFVIVLLFAPPLICFFVKPIFPRYFSKFLVTTLLPLRWLREI
jgi:hypothetical protein